MSDKSDFVHKKIIAQEVRERSLIMTGGGSKVELQVFWQKRSTIVNYSHQNLGATFTKRMSKEF